MALLDRDPEPEPWEMTAMKDPRRDRLEWATRGGDGDRPGRHREAAVCRAQAGCTGR
jgi:hypothetical protein